MSLVYSGISTVGAGSSPLLVVGASHQLSFHPFCKDGYDRAACGISLNGISFNGIPALRLVRQGLGFERLSWIDRIWSPLVARCVSSTPYAKTRGSLTLGEVTAMASPSWWQEMVVIFLKLGLSRPTAGALMISKESREIYICDLLTNLSQQQCRGVQAVSKVVNSPVRNLGALGCRNLGILAFHLNNTCSSGRGSKP